MAAGPPKWANSDWLKYFALAPEPWLSSRNKSGYTPVQYSLDPLPSPGTFNYDELCRRYQRRTMLQLTTLEIIATGAFESDQILEPNLQGIHPLFMRSKWSLRDARAIQPLYPLPEGLEGYWTMDHDVVWNAMQPVLKLASKFVSHSDCFYWWDALLFGARTQIPNLGPEDGGTRFKFSRRLPIIQQTRQAARETHRRFLSLTSKITWRFGSGTEEDGETGMPDPANNEHHANTYWSTVTGGPMVTLAIEDVLPLLWTEQPLAQRLMVQLHAAITIVHELAHALEFLQNQGWTAEPYFEDEPEAELGFSMQTAILGGDVLQNISEKWRHRSHIGPLALSIQTWPTIRGQINSSTRAPPPNSQRVLTELTYPIQLSWISNLQQESFWKVFVSAYGHEALRPQMMLRTSTQMDTIIPPGLPVTNVVQPTLMDVVQPLRTLDSNFNPQAVDMMRNQTDRLKVIVSTLKGAKAAHDRFTSTIENRRTPNISIPDHFLYDTFRDQDSYTTTPEHDDSAQKFLDFVMDQENPLALSTMTHWTPANTFLGYINRRRDSISGPGTPLPHFKEEVLRRSFRLAKSQNMWFDYSHQGAGVVRIIQGDSWSGYQYGPPPGLPLKPPSVRANLIRDLTQKYLIKYSMRIWRFRSQMRDANTATVRRVLKRAFLEGDQNDPSRRLLSGIPTQGELDDALNFLKRNNRLIGLSPKGVTRRIDAGWPRNTWPNDISDNEDSGSDNRSGGGDSDSSMRDADIEQKEEADYDDTSSQFWDDIINADDRIDIDEDPDLSPRFRHRCTRTRTRFS